MEIQITSQFVRARKKYRKNIIQLKILITVLKLLSKKTQSF